MARMSLNDYVQNASTEIDAFFNGDAVSQVQPQTVEPIRNEPPVQAPEPVQTIQVPQPQTVETPPVQPEGGAPTVPPVATTANEIAELKAEIQRLKSEAGRTKELARQLRELKQVQQQSSQLAEPPAPIIPTLTEDERLAIGDENARVMNRVASNTDEALRQTNERLRALEEEDFRQSQMALWNEIGAHFGEDIFEANDSQSYSAWCDRVDPVTGKRMGELLTHCSRQLNVDGVKTLLTDFVNATGWSSKQGTETPIANSNSTTPSVAVEQRPAPRPAQTTASANVQAVPTGQPQPRVYTLAEVDAINRRYYKDHAWRNSPEGQALFKDALETAVFEGRIKR